MNKKILLPFLISALVLFVVWSAFGQGQKTSPVRQRWEYKVCTLVRPVGSDGDWTGLYEDNIAQKPPYSIKTKIVELGDQGWELVSVTAVSNASHDGYEGALYEGTVMKTTPTWAGFTNHMVYWFKRPK